MRSLLLILAFASSALSQQFLCCSQADGNGTMLISNGPCSSSQTELFVCKFQAKWVQKEDIEWSRLKNMPTSLSGQGTNNYANRLLQAADFQAMPSYSRFVGTDSTNGVYGLYANGTRNYSHLTTFPTLFNQDIILKELINNLTVQIDDLKSKQAASDGEHPLTYLCWAWTLLTIVLFLVYKFWEHYREEKVIPSSHSNNNSMDDFQDRRLYRLQMAKQWSLNSRHELSKNNIYASWKISFIVIDIILIKQMPFDYAAVQVSAREKANYCIHFLAFQLSSNLFLEIPSPVFSEVQLFQLLAVLIIIQAWPFVARLHSFVRTVISQCANSAYFVFSDGQFKFQLNARPFYLFYLFLLPNTQDILKDSQSRTSFIVVYSPLLRKFFSFLHFSSFLHTPSPPFFSSFGNAARPQKG